MKALMLSQRDAVSISFISPEVWMGAKNNGLEAHFRCVACDVQMGWNPQIDMYQCLACEYDMSKAEAFQLALEYRANLDALIINNSVIKPKKSFWKGIFGK